MGVGLGGATAMEGGHHGQELLFTRTVHGTGRKKMEEELMLLEAKYPNNARDIAKFDVPLAHMMFAGAGFIVVPSRFEPCGLIQLQVMRNGVRTLASMVLPHNFYLASTLDGYLVQLLVIVKARGEAPESETMATTTCLHLILLLLAAHVAILGAYYSGGGGGGAGNYGPGFNPSPNPGSRTAPPKPGCYHPGGC